MAGGCRRLVLGVLMPLLYRGEWNLFVSLGIVSALWIVLPMVRDVFDKTRHASSFVAGVRKLAGLLGHGARSCGRSCHHRRRYCSV